MTPEHAIDTVWFGWLMSWTVAMFWANRAEKRDPVWPEIVFRVLLCAGLILLFVTPGGPHFAKTRLWRLADTSDWILVAVTACGLLFAWWARIHLGRLWSDLVVKKADHRIVNSGPYRLVRHPIYSGLDLAVTATAIHRGTVLALLGGLLVTLAFYLKARREERFLRTELGEDAYDAYARKTPMLLPFVRV